VEWICKLIWIQKGSAYINGKPVAGDRQLEFSYLTKPEVIEGENLPFQKSVISSNTLQIIGEGERIYLDSSG
jgi:hypothetical protein